MIFSNVDPCILSSLVAIQEMSWKIHYNTGADLETYMIDPGVFAVEDGYINTLTGIILPF
jgi:hypothetical protein